MGGRRMRGSPDLVGLLDNAAAGESPGGKGVERIVREQM